MSTYSVSKTIFEIKATEYKTNISTPMLSGSGKNVLSFGSLAASASQKSRGGGCGELLVIFPSRLMARQAKIM